MNFYANPDCGSGYGNVSNLVADPGCNHAGAPDLLGIMMGVPRRPEGSLGGRYRKTAYIVNLILPFEVLRCNIFPIYHIGSNYT